MKKKRKSRFFNDLRLRKCTFGFILSILVVCSAENACADGTVSGGGAAGAVVTIRSNDAERLGELNRLREQALRDAERIKRLELELETSKRTAGRLEAELIEQKTKFQTESERFRQQQLWLAGVRAEGTVRKDGEREEQMLQAWKNFRGPAQELDLPSAPKQFLHYFEEENRPQTRLDRNLEHGMAVSIGRLRPDSQYDYKFVCLSHNTLRGAAGGAVLLAELLCAKGYMD